MTLFNDYNVIAHAPHANQTNQQQLQSDMKQSGIDHRKLLQKTITNDTTKDNKFVARKIVLKHKDYQLTNSKILIKLFEELVFKNLLDVSNCEYHLMRNYLIHPEKYSSMVNFLLRKMILFDLSVISYFFDSKEDEIKVRVFYTTLQEEINYNLRCASECDADELLKLLC